MATSAATRRTYVLDTSVLLADPGALTRFAEHEVVLPIVVITELEAKRNHPELGFFARNALRTLDDLRLAHGRLDEPLPVGEEGGTLRVELNHNDPSVLPAGFRLGDNDTRILSVALSLSHEGHDVVLVSKDLPLRVKAASVGLAAEEYRAEKVIETGYTGMAELEIAAERIEELYEAGRLELEEARDLLCHTGLRLISGGGSALGRVLPDKSVRLVRGDREAFYRHELRTREAGALPPFGRLAALIVTASEHEAAFEHARRLLSAAPAARDLKLFGPADAPIGLIRGRYRVRLLAQSGKDFDLSGYVRFWLENGPRTLGNLRVQVDIDPQSFL